MNTLTNLSSLLTYDTTGEVDYTDKFDAFDDAYSFAEEDAGIGILTNSQDRDFRSAFNLGGWKPKGDPQAMAIEVRLHGLANLRLARVWGGYKTLNVRGNTRADLCDLCNIHPGLEFAEANT